MSNTGRKIEADALYTPTEAAGLLSLHIKTVRRHIRAGVIPAKRRIGRWRIRGAELLRLA